MKKAEKLASILFIVIGLIFLVISVFIVPSTFNYENKINTVGTITEIIRIPRSDDDDYEVYVSYKVDGNYYEGKLNGYSSTYKEGKEIEIYYDKDNPENIGVKSLDLLVLLFPLLGGISVIVGIIILVKSSGKKKLLEKLKLSGMMINADIVETKMNTAYSVNGRNPYVIVCEWFSPEDNQTLRFVSENLWENPLGEIMSLGIKTMPVYLDPNNKKKYVMDVKGVLPNAK